MKFLRSEVSAQKRNERKRRLAWMLWWELVSHGIIRTKSLALIVLCQLSCSWNPFQNQASNTLIHPPLHWNCAGVFSFQKKKQFYETWCILIIMIRLDGGNARQGVFTISKLARVWNLPSFSYTALAYASFSPSRRHNESDIATTTTTSV